MTNTEYGFEVYQKNKTGELLFEDQNIREGGRNTGTEKRTVPIKHKHSNWVNYIMHYCHWND